MDPEQRFLQARHARWSALAESHHSDHHQRVTTIEALATFWSSLRQFLTEWNARLQQVDHKQQCLNLKEELHALRQACLNPNTGSSSSSSSSTILPPELLAAIPMDLPAADWRVLHGEFTKYVQAWEEVFTTRFPKGKFTFSRYRQEVARRLALGIPLEKERVPTFRTTKSSTTAATTAAVAVMSEMDESSSLQNISDSSIHIQQDGSVWIQPTTCTSRDDEPQQPSGSIITSSIVGQPRRQQLSSGAILFRSMSNCQIQV